MRDVDLFQAALGLAAPWRVTGTEFDPDKRRLEVTIDFPAGARFGCPACGVGGCRVYDTTVKTWRHLDFFQHQAFLTARVPRVRCAECGVHLVAVAWARPGSGFSLLFEALVMTLAAEMPIAALGALVGEHDTRIWRVVHHYVTAAWEADDWSGLTRLGLDETSFRRGQDYVSVFADLDARRVVYAIEGRDAAVVAGFAAELGAHDGEPGQVAEVCIDMSAGYREGIAWHLPDAQITFDRFHLVKLLGEAVDQVRRAERLEHRELLARSRYLWLRRPQTLNAHQRERLDGLLGERLATARAYRWRLRFDAIFDLPAPAAAEALTRWQRGAVRSRLAPIVRFARTVAQHRAGILRWWTTKISNGLLEGLHSLTQAAKRRARGYRSTSNYIAMIYLVVGKLDLPSVHTM